MYGGHPTKLKLITTVATMLDELDVSDIQVEQVLERSGISKGSLYHHFVDFAHLIEAAQIHRFVRMVDRSIDSLATVLAQSTSKEQMREGLRRVTEATQRAERAPSRFERARALALAEHQPRMRAAMAQEQARLTSAIADICRDAQAKGWIRPDLDPQVVSVFIQAYTLGKVVDDIVTEPMDHLGWIKLIDDVVVRVLLAD